jgi:ferrochelatase
MKTATVLMNLGGPDSLDAVEPFLVNLFSDPAILDVPSFLRGFLARRIARRRTPVAKKIYEKLGGASPLLPNTQAQASALEAQLGDLGDVRSFIAMRYWHPFTSETVKAVADWQPDRIVLLPLYPHYSTTTTESSLGLWHEEAAKAGLRVPTRTVCCYPTEDGFISALVAETTAARAYLPDDATPLYLFSAHGLPERTEKKRRDPYAVQVRMTADAIAKRLMLKPHDSLTCFQSRVGPVKWIKPYTDECVIEAAMQRRPVVVVPIAFVSEHSETLVELDLELRDLGDKAKLPGFTRAKTVGTRPEFIAGLARLVRAALAADTAIVSEAGAGDAGRICPADRTCCRVVFGGAGQ